MSEVNIALYRMNNNANTCGKFESQSNPPQFVARVRGTFRGPFNVLAPTLELQRGISDWNTEQYDYDWYTELNNFNYAVIENCATVNPTVTTRPPDTDAEDVNRYYFVQNATVSPKGIIILSLFEDLLETYKFSVKNLNCYIERSQNHINKRIPDGYATALPGYKETKYDLVLADSSTWRSCEDVWADDDKDNLHLNYIITIGSGTVEAWTSSANSDVTNNFPVLKIIATKAYIKKFVEETNNIWSQIEDKFFNFKSMIQSIETIPDGFLATDAERFPCINNGGASSIDDSILASKINLGVCQLNVTYDNNGTNTKYGFVLPKNCSIVTRSWEATLPSSTDWEYSSNYNKYSLKFNPFGTFDIPADEVLSASTGGKVYFKIIHSLITGQAQLQYLTKTDCWKILGETVLNFSTPFISKSDAGQIFMTAARVALSVAAGKAFGAASTDAQIKSSTGDTVSYSVSVESHKGEKLFGAGAASKLGMEPTGEWFGGRRNFASNAEENTGALFQPATETWSTTEAVTKDPSLHTANAVKTGNAINVINQSLQPLPAPEIKGTLRGVFIDGKTGDTATRPPYIIRYYRDIILPPANIIGGPEMTTRRVGDYTGYTKCGWLSLEGFRSPLATNREPIPNQDEIGALTNILTTGFYVTTV